MARVYLGLGSNLGDRLAMLRDAVDALRSLGNIVTVSSVYETAPVGYLDQPPFLNAVVELDTALPAQELLPAMLEVEQSLGRERSFRNAPRTLDVDMLIYNDLVCDCPRLTIPHPRLHTRAFVLVPLVEMAAEVQHPRLARTMLDLLTELGDVRGRVWKIAEPEALSS